MPRLNTPLDVKFINDTFFPNEIPKEINQGRCFLWAYIAFRLYKRVELWSFNTHAFIRYEGKFYDSERPLGEDDWKDLPATNFGVRHDPAIRVSPKQFKSEDEWAGPARQYKVVWKEVRAQVQEVVKKYT